MRENKKYKQVKVRCFKDSRYSHYGEIFQDISEKKLEKELNEMVRAGWDRFDIEADGKKRTLIVLKKRRNPGQHTESAPIKESPVDSCREGVEIPSEPVKSRNLRDIIAVSKCEMCKHFNEETPWTCKAFPNGIPAVIAKEEIQHDKPMDGQVGNYVFERVEED